MAVPVVCKQDCCCCGSGWRWGLRALQWRSRCCALWTLWTHAARPQPWKRCKVWLGAPLHTLVLLTLALSLLGRISPSLPSPLSAQRANATTLWLGRQHRLQLRVFVTLWSIFVGARAKHIFVYRHIGSARHRQIHGRRGLVW